MDQLPIGIQEQVFRGLGEAVVKIWSRLPQDVQHDLFEGAVASQGKSKRQQLAVFLHGQHSRTPMPSNHAPCRSRIALEASRCLDVTS